MCLEERVLIVYTLLLYILLPELGTKFDHDISFLCRFPVSRVKQTFYTVYTCIRNETEVNAVVNLFLGRRDKLLSQKSNSLV